MLSHGHKRSQHFPRNPAFSQAQARSAPRAHVRELLCETQSSKERLRRSRTESSAAPPATEELAGEARQVRPARAARGSVSTDFGLLTGGEVRRAPGPPAPASNIPVRQVKHTAFILFANHRSWIFCPVSSFIIREELGNMRAICSAKACKREKFGLYLLLKWIRRGQLWWRQMRSLQAHSWAFIMAANILVASVFAKNMISFPLGYDFSCSYGVPLAIWEIYSQDHVEHFRFINGAYKVSAVCIGDRSPILNFLIDAIISLAVFYLLQNREQTNRVVRLLRKYSFILTFFLSLSLWASVFICREYFLYRFLYLAIVFFETILALLVIIKLLWCANRMKAAYSASAGKDSSREPEGRAPSGPPRP